MEPYWSDGQITLHLGDCVEVLAGMDAASVDAVVTDPPYGLGFMGKEWDSGKAFVERKPAKRNTFDHVGGNHNPVDSADAARTRRVEAQKFGRWCEQWAAECLRVLKPGGHLLAFGGTRTWHRLTCAIEDAGFEVRDSAADLTGYDSPGLMWVYGSGFPKSLNVPRAIDRAMAPGEADPPVSEEGVPWAGWGSALKPGWEPIVVARKPLAGTVAQNVLAHGTGALNVDGCRVGTETRTNNAGGSSSLQRVSRVAQGYRPTVTTSRGEPSEVIGRWPPNVVLGPEAAVELDRQSGYMEGGNRPARRGGIGYGSGALGTDDGVAIRYDPGGASRFFPVFQYSAKAPGDERPRLPDGTAHPTVKPVPLKRWLVRLVTPPGGLVCDPFAGSGTTGEACIIEGFPCVLIEKEPTSVELIRTRLRKDIQPDMFGGGAA